MSLSMILIIGVVVLVVSFAVLAGATLLSLGEKHKSGRLPNDARSSPSSSSPSSSKRRRGGAQGGSKKRRKR